MHLKGIIIKATIGVETRRCNFKVPIKLGSDELYPIIIDEVSRVFNRSVSNIPLFYTDPEGSNCAFVATTLDDALACSDASVLKLFTASDVQVADLSPLELEADTASSLESLGLGTCLLYTSDAADE